MVYIFSGCYTKTREYYVLFGDIWISIMKKRKFKYSERYAVWHCHDARCWFCNDPLRLVETTIDHFFPESLLGDDKRRKEVLAEYDLSDEFNINGFENWLPCHANCNQTKGNKILRPIPANLLVIEKLIKLAPKVEKTALEISANVSKDKIFGRIFTALEQHIISIEDLRELFGKLVEEPSSKNIPEEMILLDNGYWVFRDEIAREGVCQCERDKCVDSKEKIYCYFPPNLSAWVISKGLYWKCYDEIIQCPRCSERHKRGHIGKHGRCLKPYRNQVSQTD